MLGKYVKAINYTTGEKVHYAYGFVVHEITLDGRITGYLIQTRKGKTIVKVGNILRAAKDHFSLITGELYCDGCPHLKSGDKCSLANKSLISRRKTPRTPTPAWCPLKEKS